MLLLFKDLSPFKFMSISGLVDNNPINNLAKVPELPKFSVEFFLQKNEPSPFPEIKYLPERTFLILTPSFFRQSIVEKTSSDSKILIAVEMSLDIEPINKLLID